MRPRAEVLESARRWARVDHLEFDPHMYQQLVVAAGYAGCMPDTWACKVLVSDMDMELLVVPQCPNEASALDLTRASLKELDVSASVTTTVIESDEQAGRGFIGSRSFLINGRDPFAETDAAVGMACRVYRTPAGVPSLEKLREALRRAATVKGPLSGPPAGRP